MNDLNLPWDNTAGCTHIVKDSIGAVRAICASIYDADVICAWINATGNWRLKTIETGDGCTRKEWVEG